MDLSNELRLKKAQINDKITKFIFLNKIQGPGDYKLSDLARFLIKTMRLRGFGAVGNYAKYRFLGCSMFLRTTPFTMVCYVNSKCNLTCPYCCYGVGKGSHLENKFGFKTILGCRDLTLDDFKKLEGHPVFRNALALVLSGGEPLLNNDFFKIVDYAKDRFPLIHLTTNGTLIDRYLDELIESPLTHINVSLDAATPEGYQNMRLQKDGAKIFKKVTDNVKTLVELKRDKKPCLEVLLSHVVGKLNYKSMGKMIELTSELGADSTNFQNICGFNCKELSDQTLMLDDPEVVEFIKDLRVRYAGHSVTYPRVLSSNKTIRGCRQPFDSMAVDADGNAGPCSVLVPVDGSSFGNILNDKEVWNNTGWLKLREALIDRSKPLANSFCEDCTFLYGEAFV